MVGKKNITSPIKCLIIERCSNGVSSRTVAHEFHVGHATVSRIFNRWTATNELPVRKSGSGRKPKSTEREQRAIVRLIKADPQKNATDGQKYAANVLQVDISRRTVRRILNNAKLFGRRPAKKPLISVKNRKARKTFAREHLHWTIDNWSKVLFSDESKFMLFSSDGIRYIRRPVGKRYDIRYQVPTVKHGGGSVMVWSKF